MNVKPLFELQIHPPDIRHGVRYLFLDLRHLLAAVAGVLALLALLAWGLGLAPAVARNELSRQQYRELERLRAQQGNRLGRHGPVPPRAGADCTNSDSGGLARRPDEVCHRYLAR